MRALGLGVGVLVLSTTAFAGSRARYGGTLHVALAFPGFGPFKLSGSPGRYSADPTFPAGRPYLDELVVTSTDDRGAERLFSQRKAQLAMGLPPKDAEKVPMPYATGLLYAPTLP